MVKCACSNARCYTWVLVAFGIGGSELLVFAIASGCMYGLQHGHKLAILLVTTHARRLSIL